MPPHSGFSGSAFALALTGCVSDNDTKKLGTGHMTQPNDDGMWRYLVEVEGTGIEEYYEYDTKLDTDTVADRWLDDVAENWSDSIANQLRHNVEVTPLWQAKNQETTSEAMGLPTTQEEDSQ